MTEEKDFEKLFSEKFSDFAETPSEKVWSGIRKKLTFYDFFQFSVNSLNIYYVAVMMTAMVGGIIFYTYNDEAAPIPENNQITDTLTPETIIPEVIREESDEVELKIINKKSYLSLQNVKPGTDENYSVAKREKAEIEMPVVSDEEGKSVVQIAEKEVREQVQRIALAAFKMSVSEGCGPTMVNFSNISENAINYKWNFGDGVESNQLNPVYLFNKPGEWIVQLEATDYYGNSSFAYDTIVIKTMPKAQFEFVAETNGFPEAPVYFYNYSARAATYRWYFGDGNSSEHINPTHIYRSRDNYEVKLIAYSDEGCTDTLVLGDIFPDTDYFIRFPSAFTPNLSSPGDGRYSISDISNQVFFPVWNGVGEYHLQVYNRTGMLMFESNDLQVGWNGYYRNQLVKSDVYIWKVTGKYMNGKPFVLTGDVTVILRR